MLNREVFNIVRVRNADAIQRYGRIPEVISERDSALEDYEFGLPNIEMEEPVPPGCEEGADGQLSFVLREPKFCEDCGVEIPFIDVSVPQLQWCGDCQMAFIRQCMEEEGATSLWQGLRA